MKYTGRARDNEEDRCGDIIIQACVNNSPEAYSTLGLPMYMNQ